MERTTEKEIAESHTEEQCRHRAADRERPIAAVTPAGLRELAAVGEADRAQDERDQQQEHREVEPGEGGRVEERPGRKHRATAQDEPHLVALPHRLDRFEQRPALIVAAPDEAEGRADAQIEAVHHGEADEEDSQDEPPDQPQYFVVEHVDLISGLRPRPPPLARAMRRGRSATPHRSPTAADRTRRRSSRARRRSTAAAGSRTRCAGTSGSASGRAGSRDRTRWRRAQSERIRWPPTRGSSRTAPARWAPSTTPPRRCHSALPLRDRAGNAAAGNRSRDPAGAPQSARAAPDRPGWRAALSAPRTPRCRFRYGRGSPPRDRRCRAPAYPSSASR